jgi:hypothetical protein
MKPFGAFRRAGLCLTVIETLPPDVDAPPVEVEVLLPAVVAFVLVAVRVREAVEVEPFSGALRRRFGALRARLRHPFSAAFRLSAFVNRAMPLPLFTPAK